ncbi:MAG: universal stress protein [Eubacteriales bacterium]|jgi:nucleotide-binding universal stress UspA family protein|nr:universal stress protein [Eubacteriales bacterium]
MKILVPVDGSGYSLRAAKYAAELAEAFGDATVDFLHVIVYEPNFMDSSVTMERAGEKIAREALDDAKREFAKYSKIEPGSMIETGSSAANQVCEIAERDGYDQIVMGTKGKSNMERFLVGSVSNRILLHAPCTCTLVR